MRALEVASVVHSEVDVAQRLMSGENETLEVEPGGSSDELRFARHETVFEGRKLAIEGPKIKGRPFSR